MESILISDPAEIDAVRSGEIEGDFYADGDCYALASSLMRYRNRQPIAALEQSVEVSLNTGVTS